MFLQGIKVLVILAPKKKQAGFLIVKRRCVIELCYAFDGIFLYAFRRSIVVVLFVVQASEEVLVVGRGAPLMQDRNVCVVQERATK